MAVHLAVQLPFTSSILPPLNASKPLLPSPPIPLIPQGRTRRVPLKWIKRFSRGQETEVFKRYPQPAKSYVSFSIHYVDRYDVHYSDLRGTFCIIRR